MTDTSESFLIPPEYYFQTTYKIPFDEELEKAVEENKRPENISPLPNLMFADSESPANVLVALAWNHSGVACFIEQENFHLKKYSGQRNEESILLYHSRIDFFFDTRDMKSNKRINRFCSRFTVTFPFQYGKRLRPSRLKNYELNIEGNQADADQFHVSNTVEKDCCRIALWIPKQNLTGYDPENVPSLGFFYAGHFAEEHDDQLYGLSEKFPYATDPGLWHSVMLKNE